MSPIQKMNINTKIFRYDLLHRLSEIISMNDDFKDIAEALSSLCRIDLLEKNDFPISSFTPEEHKLLKDKTLVKTIDNYEILARLNDFLQVEDNKNRCVLIPKAVDNYMKLFELSNEYSYLFRRLKLVRKAIGLFSTQIDEIFEYCKNVLLCCEFPYWQARIIEQLAGINKQKSKTLFDEFLNKQIDEFYKSNEYDNVRHCLCSLLYIESLTNNEYRIKNAESYEKEGDHIVDSKKPNTFYPTISQIYLTGLREIKGVENCDKLRCRLEEKLDSAQREDFNMIVSCGINIPQKNSNQVRKDLFDYGIKDFLTGFQELLNFPLISKDKIEEISKTSNKEFLSSLMFNSNVRLNDKGRRTAVSDDENHNKYWFRNFFREQMIEHFIAIKQIMDIDGFADKEYVYGLIKRSNSRFLADERFLLYLEGLYAGFQGHFILSAHILIPQIEHSLKYVAEQNNCFMAQFVKDIQNENALGGCLDKMHEKGIIINDDLYEELKSFLVDSNGVNFRNELCHGLMHPSLIQYYGIYIWWLSLKIITHTDKYFSLKKS